MIKKILVVSALVGVLFPAAAFAVVLDQSSYTESESKLVTVCFLQSGGFPTGHLVIYELDTASTTQFFGNGCLENDDLNSFIPLNVWQAFTNFSVIEVGDFIGCQGLSYDDCKLDTEFVDEFLFSVNPDPPPPPVATTTPILSVPVDGKLAMLSATGDLVLDLFPIIALVIGIPLAFYIIKEVIQLVPAANRKND